MNSLKQSNENLQKHVEELLNKLKEVRQLEIHETTLQLLLQIKQ